jgi:hypothetical protein
MVHLKIPFSIKKYFGSVCEKYWLPSTNCQNQNKLPCSKKHGIGMGIKYFLHQEQGGSNPKRLLNKTLGWISRSHPPFLLITT